MTEPNCSIDYFPGYCSPDVIAPGARPAVKRLSAQGGSGRASVIFEVASPATHFSADVQEPDGQFWLRIESSSCTGIRDSALLLNRLCEAFSRGSARPARVLGHGTSQQEEFGPAYEDCGYACMSLQGFSGETALLELYGAQYAQDELLPPLWLELDDVALARAVAQAIGQGTLGLGPRSVPW